MRIIADTNLLVRMVVSDNPEQAREAREVLAKAAGVVITRQVLCELAWVLDSRYKLPRAKIVEALCNIRDAQNAILDSTAINAGLAAMQAGADFADGVIAYEGRMAGGEVFVSVR
jgi:predicted nucleic-acid-binding protein